MLQGHVRAKILIGLILGATILGLVLAKIFYPTANPLIQEDKAEVEEKLPYVFPVNNELPFKFKKSTTPPPPAEPKKQVCIQVITPAINKETLEIREFSSPCAVPEGWDPL